MYNNVAKNLEVYEIVYPETIVPQPNENDYSNGFITRYFTRKSNDLRGHIFEINDTTYLKYLKTKDPHWVTDSIRWRIRGPIQKIYNADGTINDMGVMESNKASISTVLKTLPNLKLYLPNLLQFYK